MTDERMALQSPLEKTPDADLLRRMIGFAAQRLMELDIESHTGAAHGERSPDRLAQRRYHDVPDGGEAALFGMTHMDQVQSKNVIESIVTVLAAIELSKTTWLLAIHDPTSNKVSRRRSDGGDVEGLIGILQRCRQRADLDEH